MWIIYERRPGQPDTPIDDYHSYQSAVDYCAECNDCREDEEIEANVTYVLGIEDVVYDVQQTRAAELDSNAKHAAIYQINSGVVEFVSCVSELSQAQTTCNIWNQEEGREKSPIRFFAIPVADLKLP